MFRSAWSGIAASVIGVVLAGCASTPREQAASRIDELTAARQLPRPGWPGDASSEAAAQKRTEELLAQLLTLERSLQLAFLRNPGIRTAYAELGIAQSDVIEASRLPNPTFGYSRLRPDGGGHSQITRGLSLPLADLLLLPARRRFARAEFENAQLTIGNALVDLASSVETAWFDYVSAKQVAEMRRAVSRAADAAAEFAQRSREAGNISARNLALELAAASEARIDAANAAADATRARLELAAVLGISVREKWDTANELPAPPGGDAEEGVLLETALRQRMDAMALRRNVALLEDALTLSRRWRFLGEVSVRYERESETDGARLSGPTLDLQLPIFNQGQGAVLRARSQLELAKAELATVELSIRNDVALALDRLAASRDIAEQYRTALIPQREAVVARTMEEYNFMLAGVFELLQAKREEFDAYQQYLEAVRDYWITRVELKRVAGGQLPGDEQSPKATLGVDEIIKPMPAEDHSQHQGMGANPKGDPPATQPESQKPSSPEHDAHSKPRE